MEHYCDLAACMVSRYTRRKVGAVLKPKRWRGGEVGQGAEHGGFHATIHAPPADISKSVKSLDPAQPPRSIMSY